MSPAPDRDAGMAAQIPSRAGQRGRTDLGFRGMLTAGGWVNASELQSALSYLGRDDPAPHHLSRILAELGLLTERELLTIQSAYVGLPVAAFAPTDFDPAAAALVPAVFACRHGCVPVHRRDGVLTVLVAAPLPDSAFAELTRMTRSSVAMFLVVEREIATVFGKVYPNARDSNDQRLAFDVSSLIPARAGRADLPGAAGRDWRRRRRGRRAMTFQFPYRCDGIPKFETQRAAEHFVREYQRARRMKPCRALAIVPSTLTTLSPWCRHDGFKRQRDGGAPRADRFYGCPVACRFYQPVRAWKRQCDGVRARVIRIDAAVVGLLALLAFVALTLAW